MLQHSNSQLATFHLHVHRQSTRQQWLAADWTARITLLDACPLDFSGFAGRRFESANKHNAWLTLPAQTGRGVTNSDSQ